MRTCRFSRSLAVALALLFSALAPRALQAQDPTGAIEGSVSDKSAATIARARQDDASGASR